MNEARSETVRRSDTERRFAEDTDVWVATASADGVPHLVPLSFYWDGAAFLLATPAASPTGVNLAESGTAQLAFGQSREVALVQGDIIVLEIDELPDTYARKYVARTGWDPRSATQPCRWFCVTPKRIQVWREENELAGRELIRGGAWIV